MFEEILTIGYWISLLISSLLGMCAIIIGIKIAKRKPSFIQAFLVSLIANILTTLGILGIISTILPIPYAYYIISALIWIGMIKFLFPVNLKEAVIIGGIGFIIMAVFEFFGITSLIITFGKIFRI